MRLRQRLSRLEARMSPEVERPSIDVSMLSDDILGRLIECDSDLSLLSDDDLAELEAARIDCSSDGSK